MIVQSFFVNGIAHSSYLLGGSSTCAIVDPRRDIEIYLKAAKDLNLKITHILQTHLHADFVSGHMDLARATGASIVMPKAAKAAFEHIPVSEGDTLSLEDVLLEILETPGHTPEHVTYVARDLARGSEPVSIFCGDTLFVGDVGRPDLFPGKAAELAGLLYDSLHAKILPLPDFCEVYPAHGAGSLCGRSMGAKRESTIGYERRFNEALRIINRDAFVIALTSGMPAAPDHFARCSEINREGPTLVDSLPFPSPLGPRAFSEKMASPETLVLDIRDFSAFGGNHVPGSVNLDLGGNFATFAGWVLPPEKEILLVSDRPEAAETAVTWLRRVGLDRVTATLEGSIFAWAKAGLPTAHVPQVSPYELQDFASSTGTSVTILDVRSPSEFESFHIPGSVNIPAPELRHRFAELDPGSRIVTVCGTGHRSSLAASLLLQRGFKNVHNLAGGMMGYAEAGLGPSCPLCVSPHGPRFMGKRTEEALSEDRG
ncbi:MAG: MBL fold metallo-hydrolase [Synergistaceae bacterium]|nr:MBL fold metallo-hydrolase [Synergistaceae bacterium]